MYNPYTEEVDRVTDELRKKYDFNLPKINSHQLFLGGTDSGKSLALSSYLLTYYQDVYNRIVVVCRNARYDIYRLMLDIPQEDIINDLEPEAVGPKVEQVFEELERKWHESDYKYCALIIFDDQGENFKSKYFSFIKNRVCECRKFNIALMFVCQHAKQLPPCIRQQIQTISIQPVFTEPEDLRNILSGFPGISIKSTAKTPESKMTAQKAVQIVQAINEENQTRYGRVYHTYTEPENYYYQIAVPEEVKEEVTVLGRDGEDHKRNKKINRFVTKMDLINPLDWQAAT